MKISVRIPKARGAEDLPETDVVSRKLWQSPRHLDPLLLIRHVFFITRLGSLLFRRKNLVSPRINCSTTITYNRVKDSKLFTRVDRNCKLQLRFARSRNYLRHPKTNVLQNIAQNQLK